MVGVPVRIIPPRPRCEPAACSEINVAHRDHTQFQCLKRQMPLQKQMRMSGTFARRSHSAASARIGGAASSTCRARCGAGVIRFGLPLDLYQESWSQLDPPTDRASEPLRSVSEWISACKSFASSGELPSIPADFCTRLDVHAPPIHAYRNRPNLVLFCLCCRPCHATQFV